MKPKPNTLTSLCGAALVAVAAIFAPAAPAQGINSYGASTVLAGGTNNVAASTTDTTILPGGGVSAGRHDAIGLLITQKPHATNVQANVSYVFARGLSATETESIGSVVVIIPTHTNAAAQSAFAKVDMAGAAYLKLIAITNGSSVPITNIAIKALLKAPGTYGFTR